MAANLYDRYEIEIEDVEYLRHVTSPFWRAFTNRAERVPSPELSIFMAARWSVSDRKLDAPIATPLARSGVMVASLDFHTPVELSYPGPPEDGAGAMRFYILCPKW